MTNRDDRLSSLEESLREAENIAQVRVRNAEQSLAGTIAGTRLRVFCAELDAAREALRAIHEEQSSISRQRARHDVPETGRAMVLVGDAGGYRILERRDADRDTWYDLSDADGTSPMSFAEAVGVATRPEGAPFERLYHQDEVDDLLDRYDTNR